MNNNIIITEEEMRGVPYILQQNIKQELVQQLQDLDYRELENLKDNFIQLIECMELIEEHINDDYIELAYNPMGAWYVIENKDEERKSL